MKKICFFEFWNCTPHIETAFELAKLHLDAGDEVHFYFGGHDLPLPEGVQITPETTWVKYGLMKLPECHAAELLLSPRFHFYPHITLAASNWVSPQAQWTLDSLRDYTYQGYEAGLAVLSSLVSLARSDNPDFVFWHNDIVKMLSGGIRVFETVSRILEQTKPDMMYVFNGRFYACRAVMNAAQAVGIPYKIHERGADKTRYYSKPYMPHDMHNMQVDIKKTWARDGHSAAAKKIGAEYFENRRQGKDQAWIAFTKEQKIGALPAIDPDKKIITYYSSSDDEFIAVGDIHKWEYWPGQFEALMDLISICEARADLQLVIRMHPNKKMMSSEYLQKWYELVRFSSVTVLRPSSEVDSYELLLASDIVAACGSTIGIEAVFWNKPSICLGPSLYGSLGAVYEPKGLSELELLVTADQLAVDPEKSLSYGYYMSTFGEKFMHYEAETLFRGKFLGVDLQKPGPMAQRLKRVYKKILRVRKKIHQRFGV